MMDLTDASDTGNDPVLHRSDIKPLRRTLQRQWTGSDRS
jgi:hypothetical protein